MTGRAIAGSSNAINRILFFAARYDVEVSQERIEGDYVAIGKFIKLRQSMSLFSVAPEFSVMHLHVNDFPENFGGRKDVIFCKIFSNQRLDEFLLLEELVELMA